MRLLHSIPNDKRGWRFYQKPGGLELYFLKPELIFTFFFYFLTKAVVDGLALLGAIFAFYVFSWLNASFFN
jgi:hypothetical protein